jgi:hypothetical protein
LTALREVLEKIVRLSPDTVSSDGLRDNDRENWLEEMYTMESERKVLKNTLSIHDDGTDEEDCEIWDEPS